MDDSAIILLVFTSILSLFINKAISVDTISVNQTIKDGDNTIESSNGMFQLGFFGSKNRYLGIWYKKIQVKTVVWVANRETPLTDTSGVLRVNRNGSLVIMDGANRLIWSSNSSGSAMSPVGKLLDDGNLVIVLENETDSENFIWQSFDHPGDNLLSDMKIGWDLRIGLDRHLTSWRSLDDPFPGNYRLGMNLDGYPQILLWNGSNLHFRFGPWDSMQFSGLAFDIPDTSLEVKSVRNSEEVYSTIILDNSTIAMRMMLTPDGYIKILRWIDKTKNWKVLLTAPKDECGQYGSCGNYGYCNFTLSKLGHGKCRCLKGYTPKFSQRWKMGDWSDGCIRKTPLTCGNGDAFVKYPSLKLPDTRRSWFDENMNHDDCRSKCLKNCACTAYSYLDIREGGIGCLLWFDELLDIRDYRPTGLDLYVKVAASELNRNSIAKMIMRIIVIVVAVSLPVLVGLFIKKAFMTRKLRRKGKLAINPEISLKNENEREDLELPLFGFQSIADATNNFSQNNKLGEGGFGPVYKGILDEGQEIAVKRLSEDSSQGLGEFKNEVSCIAKLQHRNLVRLLGCCIERGEMLLIYEYMPNKSLDAIIFDKELSKCLHWPQRYNIINGIARGILYLHQDSRLRIIHRDLKASNILLDCEMNPRISDFGMARCFGASGRLNTTKVVGTFGYMSPEYALDGIFSVKSDVYSFGVIVLEIISGKKMVGFYHSDPSLNLLGHAWKLYKDGKFLELAAGEIVESCNPSEVLRAIKIGLLCVQPHPEDRPSMPLVVLMLSSEIELAEPKQPGFFTERIHLESDYSSSNLPELSASNRDSITNLSAR